MEPIILASSSIRRQEILRQMGIPFSVMTPRIAEALAEGVPPAQGVVDIARKKVESVLAVISDRYLPWVLGADTLIFRDGTAIGKPATREEARETLASLAGRSHTVITGLALYSGRGKTVRVSHEEAIVRFRSMDADEIDWYLDTGEWQGAAGAYKIQGLASFFIDRIEGQYHTVVGLPISGLYAMLKQAGYSF